MPLPLVPLIMAGGMALKGGLDAAANKKKQEKLDAFRKRSIAMSPWSGLGDPGAMSAGNQDLLGGAIGGGMKGAMMGYMAGPEGMGLWEGASKTGTDAVNAAAAGATPAPPASIAAVNPTPSSPQTMAMGASQTTPQFDPNFGYPQLPKKPISPWESTMTAGRGPMYETGPMNPTMPTMPSMGNWASMGRY